MDEPSELRSAAISAAPDPIGSRQSVPRGPSGPRRSETSPSERRSPPLTSHTPGSSSSRTDWSLSGLAPLGPGRDVPADGKPDRQAASSGAAPAMVRSVRSRGRS